MTKFQQSILLLLLSFTISSCGLPLTKAKREAPTEKPSGFSAGSSELQHSQLSKIGPYYALFYWMAGPFDNSFQESSLAVQLFNADLEKVDLRSGEELFFFASMPSMGHGPDHPGEFKRVSLGNYINSTIKFNMGGEWEMILYILDNEEQEVGETLWLEQL